MAAESLSGARVALVSGASSPIGGAVCAALATAGWHVAEAIDELEQVDAVELLVTTRSEDADALAFGAIDPATWQRALDEQLRMTVHCARAVLPGMVARGRGQIVAVVSADALDGGERRSHRAAADGAVIGLAKALAREYGPQGIAVNALAPGAIAPRQVAESVLFLAREPHYFAGQVLSPSEGRIL